ncbi:MAG: hypothetical protein KDA32_06790 [Phycisphaerales bacterium]|nr:hypothetical protein [Phycisphaerales bacterium]
MTNRIGRLLSLCAFAIGGVGMGAALAADHGDAPLLADAGRNDARLTDLFAFTRGENLVLAVCLDPAVPVDATEYTFSSDLKVSINIDNHSEVRFDNADDVATYGGTIVNPNRIRKDVSFKIRFDRLGRPHLRTSGLRRQCRDIRLFAGLRDDPFIRGPRLGRNVAAIVIELPLECVVDRHGSHGHNDPDNTLLIWATSDVPELDGPFQDMAGRALRSMFPENDAMNQLEPRRHSRELGVAPDVVIFNTDQPAAFPNGRELADDVVDLVGDPRILGNDAPFPTENDRPFLSDFPYLPTPHLPAGLSADPGFDRRMQPVRE